MTTASYRLDATGLCICPLKNVIYAFDEFSLGLSNHHAFKATDQWEIYFVFRCKRTDLEMFFSWNPLSVD